MNTAEPGQLAQGILNREMKLRFASEAYYNSTPVLTDTSYDSLWRQHQVSRREHPQFFDASSNLYLFGSHGTILDRVGAAPKEVAGFTKVRHGNRMLSINDVFEGEGTAQYEELIEFVRDMERKVGQAAWPMLVEPKIDGLAAKVIYSGGMLQIAVTRGDGEVGDDITDNVRTLKLVPEVISPDAAWAGTPADPLNHPKLEVIGEIYMPLSAFAEANAEREKEGLQLWANPRNAASGAIKLQDEAELRKRPLAFIRHDGRSPFIQGMQVVPFFEAHDLSSLIQAVEMVRKSDYGFAIDGAVVKLDNLGARAVLGLGTRAPNWACAFKFRPVQVETKLLDILVQVGRTGALTPVAVLDPVLVDGSTVGFATLHNEDHIRNLGLQIGDTVVLQKAGAIIPEIAKSVTYTHRLDELLAWSRANYSNTPEGHEARAEDAIEKERPPFDLFAFIKGRCPACGEESVQKQVVQKDEGSRWMCCNHSCRGKLGRRIQHLASRGCLDIEGIGAEAANAIAEMMGDMNITNPFDILAWTVGDLQAVSWTTASGGTMTFGESRAEKAAAAIKVATSMPLHRWLWALGVPSIGENTSKEISRLCKDWREIVARTEEGGLFDLIAKNTDKNDPRLKDYTVSSHLGPVSCQALCEMVREEEPEWEALVDSDAQSNNYDPTPKASDDKPLFGLTFVITGTLSVGRDEMKALIEAKGGKVSGSVSAKTDYLVVGEGGGSKAAKAQEKGVKTIDEAALRTMLGGAGS